jgi:hypothetical protein
MCALRSTDKGPKSAAILVIVCEGEDGTKAIDFGAGPAFCCVPPREVVQFK